MLVEYQPLIPNILALKAGASTVLMKVLPGLEVLACDRGAVPAR